jgi:BlaI family transcriptional regulator, penicillinase repressor
MSLCYLHNYSTKYKVNKTMPRTPQDVTEAELSVLQRMWDQGSVTVRQLAEELYPGGGSSEYATVQKLLERLGRKGYVERNRDVWPHVFESTVDRDELIGRRLQSTADQLCDGALQPLLSTLVKSNKLSAKERQSLRGLLDELENERNSR